MSPLTKPQNRECQIYLLHTGTSLSARAFMQLPSASKDLLMLAPSLNRAPLFEVTMARSDPARSIRDIFPMVMFAFKLAVLSLCLRNTCNVLQEKQ